MHFLWTRIPVAVVLLTAGLLATRSSAAERPNVVLIFVDDLGYADIGCFGSTKHRTPHVDRMASAGMRLTSFYVTSGVCSPSRASLMTGCYPRRVNLHVDHKGGWVLFPRGRKGLHPDEITLAEVLGGAGYATAIVGKWHLGDQPAFLPTRQGFDSYFGIPYSNDMGWTDRKQRRYPPLPVLENEKVIEQEPDQRELTQRYTARAVQFITQNKDRPFFLYLPHTMPHWPQYSSERFAGKSRNGKWGDAVEEVDWSTGVILDTLQQLKLDSKTLVIFMSDNGGATRHGASNAPLRGAKGSTFEGGQRVCCVVRWPGRIPAGTTVDALATSMDWLPTLAGLAGARLDSQRKIDGKDIWPLLSGTEGAASPHAAFFYYKMDTLECVRSGRWKLRVAVRGRNQAQQKPFTPVLYDLEADIGESRDVAAQHPQEVARLQKLAAAARIDLGDRGRPGKNQRPAGMVAEARGLTDPAP